MYRCLDVHAHRYIIIFQHTYTYTLGFLLVGLQDLNPRLLTHPIDGEKSADTSGIFDRGLDSGLF